MSSLKRSPSRNLRMSKPRRLLYPTELIQQGMDLLSKKLHRLRRQVERGTLSKAEGRTRGHRILEEHYSDQLDIINKFVEEKGLTGVTGSEQGTQEALEEAKRRWNGIIDDMSGVQSLHTHGSR